MNDCINCNGIGYTGIVGDNDIECKMCGGTGEQPTYHLAHPLLNFRLPFPFRSRSEAERHNASLDCGYLVIECGERVVEVDEFEALELDRAVEDEIERYNHKYEEITR